MTSLLSNWRTKLAAFFGLTSFGTYLWLANRLRQGLDFNDETEKVVDAEMMAHGHRLYLDIFSQHGPMAFMLAHLTYALTHKNNIAIYRCVPILLEMATCGALLWGPVLRGWTTRFFAVGVFSTLVILCQALWSLNMGMYQVEAGYFFAIAALLWILPALLQREPVRWAAFAGGFAMGCAFFCGYSFVLGCFFMTLAAMFAAVFAAPVERRKVWGWTLWAALGGIASFAIMALWLTLYGDLKGYIIYHFIFNQTIYKHYAFEHGEYSPLLILKMIVPIWGYYYILRYVGHGGSPEWSVSVQTAEVMYLEMWLFCTLLFVGIRTSPYRTKLGAFILWALFLLGVIYTNPRGAWDFHDATMVITVAALMAVITGLCFEQVRVSRPACIAALIGIAFGFGWLGCIQTRAATFIWELRPVDYYRHAGELREEDGPLLQAINKPLFVLIRELVGKNEPIEALPFNPIDYIHAQRLPASGYIYALPWQMDYLDHPIAGYKMDLCADLAEKKPKVVIFDSSILIWNFRSGEYLECAQDYLNRHYVRYVSNDNLWIRADIVLAHPELLTNSIADRRIETSGYTPEEQDKLRDRIVLYQLLQRDNTRSCLRAPDLGHEHEPLMFLSCSSGIMLRVGFDHVADGYRLIQQQSFDCLEVTGASKEPGVPLRFWPCMPTPAQIFTPEVIGGDDPVKYRIHVNLSGLCVTYIKGLLTQGDCATAQIWPFYHAP